MKTKKLLSLFLTVVLMLSLLPAVAAAEGDFTLASPTFITVDYRMNYTVFEISLSRGGAEDRQEEVGKVPKALQRLLRPGQQALLPAGQQCRYGRRPRQGYGVEASLPHRDGGPPHSAEEQDHQDRAQFPQKRSGRDGLHPREQEVPEEGGRVVALLQASVLVQAQLPLLPFQFLQLQPLRQLRPGVGGPGGQDQEGK